MSRGIRNSTSLGWTGWIQRSASICALPGRLNRVMKGRKQGGMNPGTGKDRRKSMTVRKGMWGNGR